MYTVELQVEAHLPESIAHFARQLTCSFVPYPGLRLLLRGDDGEDEGLVIDEVTWDVDGGRFLCHVVDDQAEAGRLADVARFWATRGFEAGRVEGVRPPHLLYVGGEP